MDKAVALDGEALLPFLDRRRRSPLQTFHSALEPALGRVLESLARFLRASEVTVYLDDPQVKLHAPENSRLTCVAALGARATQLLGSCVHHSEQLAGEVYTRSAAITEKDEDGNWALGVPLLLGSATCGALLLRLPEPDDRARELAEVFSFFIGCAAETTIDGVRARDAERRDHLTGLPNESFFHFRLREELKQTHIEGAHLALMVLDVDNFRRINDRHGYWFGSQTMREIGLLLRSMAPPGALVARIGGDEFAVTVSGLDRAGSEQLAQRLRRAIEKRRFCEEHPEERVTVSIGVATFPEDLAQIDTMPEHTTAMIRLADAAMRLAKERGRNRVADSSQVDLDAHLPT